MSHQAMIYMRWVRFAVDVVLEGRSFVVINMDETSIHTVKDTGQGLKSRSKPEHSVTYRRRDAEDRSDVKTTLLATVCDAAGLQPFLPQVLLPKYTRNAAPPRTMLAEYASTGSPLEYWHGTAGMATTTVIKRWATRMRSIIHSFDPEAWILLIWDCSQTHLNLEVASHLRRLGILVIMVPAKLTWLLQVCDVCVFRELKTRMRMQKSCHRLSADHGQLNVGEWVSCCASAVREVIVNRSWEDSFDKMGLGSTLATMAGRARRAIDPDHVHAGLPTRAEFARMVNRSADTEAFRRLHQSIVGYFLQVFSLPVGMPPRQGAVCALPEVPEARKRARLEAAGDVTWEDVLQAHLSNTPSRVRSIPHGREPALNRTIVVPMME